MSYYSIYFLLQNTGIEVNCSVYSLSLGSIQFEDFFNHTLSSNQSNLLPAYYVTNCSISDVLNQIQMLQANETDILRWLEEYKKNPYTIADNGDSLISLLFVFLGLCVSCWMLMLLVVLLPKSKSKPWLNKLSILLFLILLTIMLTRITEITKEEYYDDLINMVNIVDMMMENNFPIVAVLLSFVTDIGLCQIGWKMTKLKYQKWIFGILISLSIATLISSCIGASRLKSLNTAVAQMGNASWFTSIGFKSAFVLLYSAVLAQYTSSGIGPNSMRISYSKRFLPLGVLTWLMILSRMILAVILVSLWKEKTLINTWLTLCPLLLDVYILTASWEWFYSIQNMEQKMELRGMLGRRISLHDVMNFSDNADFKKTINSDGHSSFLSGLFATGCNAILRLFKKNVPTPDTTGISDQKVPASGDNSVLSYICLNVEDLTGSTSTEMKIHESRDLSEQCGSQAAQIDNENSGFRSGCIDVGEPEHGVELDDLQFLAELWSVSDDSTQH